jgi:carbonic anhydrase
MITFDQALENLLAGNRRYVADTPLHTADLARRRAEVAGSQRPFATVVGCADSRVPLEIVFDARLGDLLAIRTAGHVLDSAVIGSIEFGAAVLGNPLVLVLGHDRCGAVQAAVESLADPTELEGSIGELISRIRPAVELAKDRPGDLVANAVRANVELVVESLRASPILASRIEAGTTTVIGGHYDLDTGVVEIIVA